MMRDLATVAIVGVSDPVWILAAGRRKDRNMGAVKLGSGRIAGLVREGRDYHLDRCFSQRADAKLWSLSTKS